MYIDSFPELAHARKLRSKARGIPIREAGRAAAIAWVADGSLAPADQIVRFDVAEGEKAPRRLVDAFEQTQARSIHFFGGDDVVRSAIRTMDLNVVADSAAFQFKRAPVLAQRVTFRELTMRDSLAFGELQRDNSAMFSETTVRVAEIDGDAVGMTMVEDIDKNWSEIRCAVIPAQRGKGYGAAILGAMADSMVAAEGRLIAAAIYNLDERARLALERGGFRLVDYYFTASVKTR